MIHLANILIATDDPTFGHELLVKIRRHNYTGRVVSDLGETLLVARAEHPDVILVGSSVGGTDQVSFGRALKETPDLSEIPVCLIADARSPALKADAYLARIDDVLSPPLDDSKLAARLRPLVRLATMQGEMHRRAQTVRRFGFELSESPPRVTVADGYPLLLVGPTAKDFASIFSDAEVAYAADPFAAEDLLEGGHFDAAVLLPEPNPGPYLDLCAQTRNNPRLFNLPVVIVTEPDRVGETVSYHYGASGFFVTPVNPEELKTAVLSLVRRQRLRWEIRGIIGKALQPATRDSGTGVFSRAYLEADLEDRIAYATAHNRHLTISFFQVPDVQEIRTRFGEDQANHLRLQVAQWITGLLRGEDLTARYEENEFCVVLPDTAGDEAAVVMKRISGVLAYTDFAVMDVYQPVKVWVRVGSANLELGDTAQSLIDRARINFLS